MSSDGNKEKSFTPVQILAIGFVIVIFIGTILLSLPIASKSGVRTPIIDCFFTSTSATCVTGLITLNTSTYWSYFGKTVIMILIEVGGLGFMSFATLFALIVGKKITLSERLIMQEAMNSFSMQGIVRLAKYILYFTFLVEAIGAILLSTQFIPLYGISKGIYFSIFHSISAFCNAGFDLTGNSLIPYSSNVIIMLVISMLIIVGGLGFYVWNEIYNYRKTKRISTHSKFVIAVTGVLILCGTVLMLLFEYNNPETLKNQPLWNKILASFFASITPRTAGFNSISTSGMTVSGKFLTIILMFIGGSPGSTAGGIKTTTVGILIMTVICVLKGKQDTEVFKRRISKNLIYRAFSIALIGFFLVITVTMLLSITQSSFSFMDLLYEATSAFGTVGLTLGVTPKLTNIGKIIISITMYCGRVGPMTVALALAQKVREKPSIRYPEDKIMVG